MKIRKMIRVVSAMMAMLMLCTGVTAFAAYEEPAQPQDNGYYVWEVESVTDMGECYRGSKQLFAVSGEATRYGELFSVEYSETLEVEFSGTIEVSNLNLSAALGFSVTQGFSLSESITSAPLEEGQYVKAYYRPMAIKYKVVQKEYYVLHQEHMGSSGRTVTGYVYKPILPELSLEYYFD